MKSTTAVLMLLCLALTTGCGKKESEEKKAKEPESSAGPTETARPAEPALPVEKKPLQYSAEAAAKMIAELEKCEYDFSCKPFKPLVSFGKKVSADLVKLASDAAKPKKGRTVAAQALIMIKDPGIGMQMVEAAKQEKDFMLREKLFMAASAGGSDKVFSALSAYYLDDKGKDHKMQVRAGLRMYRKRALDWAVAQLLKKPKKNQVELADIVTDTAGKESLKAIQELLPRVKATMAAHRLASVLMKLGDAKGLDVLVKGLKSKDQYDRSDAANFLANVVKMVPQSRKAELIKLLKAAKAKDRGGLTSLGYARCLKALEK